MKKNRLHLIDLNRARHGTTAGRHLLAALAPVLAAGISAFASGDYGPAIWRPNCGQYYTSGNGHQFVVIHDMEGYYASTISYFQNCGTSSSVHYCVNGLKDTSTDYAAGEVTQMVSEANYAFHVICWNRYCLGTEHEGFESNPAWFTQAMYDATGALQKHLVEKFGIAKDRNHVVGHNAWQNSNWRGYAAAVFGIDPNCNTHTDPGSYWDWDELMSIINGDTGSPAPVAGPDAVSWGAGRLDVLVRGGHNSIYHKYWTGGSWLPSGGFETLGGTSSSGPAICSWSANRLDAFCRGADNALWHAYWTGSSWTGWQSLGGAWSSSPAAVSWGSGRIDVAVRNGSNISHTWYDTSDGQGWHGYEDLGGGNAVTAPAICSWASGRLDVFYRGSDNALWHKWFSSGWSGWQSLGGNFNGTPGATCWGSGRIDVVARQNDNSVGHTWYDTSDGLGWHGWQSLGGSTIAAKCAISSGTSGRLDVYCIGGDSALYHKYYSGGWSGWESLGGVIQ